MSRTMKKCLDMSKTMNQSAGMSDTTKRIMRQFRRRLTRLTNLELTACGHHELMDKACDCRFALEDWLEAELEKLGGGK